MWSLGRFLVVLFAVLGFISTPATAVALSQANTITVSATILPNKIIYVDESFKIQKIVSNCTIDVTPTVYSTSDASQTLTLTDNIVRQYDFVKSNHNLNQVGTVYTYQAPALALPTPKPRTGLFQLSNLFWGNIFQSF